MGWLFVCKTTSIERVFVERENEACFGFVLSWASV